MLRRSAKHIRKGQSKGQGFYNTMARARSLTDGAWLNW